METNSTLNSLTSRHKPSAGCAAAEASLVERLGNISKKDQNLFRSLSDRVEDFFVGRPEDRHHDFAKSDDTLLVDDDHAAPSADQVLHVVFADSLALGIRKQPHRQPMIRRESAVFLYRVRVDANYFGPGLLIA